MPKNIKFNKIQFFVPEKDKRNLGTVESAFNLHTMMHRTGGEDFP